MRCIVSTLPSIMEKLQYPIGKWNPPTSFSWEEIQANIEILKSIPAAYKALTADLSAEDLQKQYRVGSWTIQQIVNHVADTHILHYIRFKHSLTEADVQGVIGNIDAWANLTEAQTAPIEYSLTLLEGIHQRWGHLLSNMSPEDFEKGYYHPMRKVYVNLSDGLHMGIWHGQHHLSHIKLALGLS